MFHSFDSWLKYDAEMILTAHRDINPPKFYKILKKSLQRYLCLLYNTQFDYI